MSKPRYNINESVFRHKYMSEGLTGLEMAQFFHIGRTTVSRYLKIFDIPERNLSETRAIKKWKPSDETKAKMRESHKDRPKGKNSPFWQGGTWIDDWGYRRILVDGKYLKEHRYVMQQSLDRPLQPTEHVHHINGNKLDNRLQNLQLLDQSAHQKLHWSDPQRRQEQADKIRIVRRERFWSTRKTNKLS